METKVVAGVDLREAMLDSIKHYAEAYVLTVQEASSDDVQRMCELAFNRFVGNMNGRGDGQKFVDSLVASAFERHILSMMSQPWLQEDITQRLKAWISLNISAEKMPEQLEKSLNQAVSDADAKHAARRVEADELKAWRLAKRGMSKKEISEALAIPQVSVERLLISAKNRVSALKKQLKAYEDIKSLR